jgi:hypothetical protein
MNLAAIGPRSDEPEAILWADEAALRSLVDALRQMTDSAWAAR